MKNLQHQTNTHLTLVFLHLMGFLLHFLIRSLQLLTQLGLLAALCLCQLGLQAGNDLPGKPPTETRQPFHRIRSVPSSAAQPHHPLPGARPNTEPDQNHG